MFAELNTKTMNKAKADNYIIADCFKDERFPINNFNTE